MPANGNEIGRRNRRSLWAVGMLVSLAVLIMAIRAIFSKVLISNDADRNLIFILISATIAILVFGEASRSTASLKGKLPLGGLEVSLGGSIAALVAVYFVLLYNIKETRTLTIAVRDQSGRLVERDLGVRVIATTDISRRGELGGEGRVTFTYMPLDQNVVLDIEPRHLQISNVIPESCVIGRDGAAHVVENRCNQISLTVQEIMLGLKDVSLSIRDGDRFEPEFSSILNSLRQDAERYLHNKRQGVAVMIQYSSSFRSSARFNDRFPLRRNFETGASFCQIVHDTLQQNNAAHRQDRVLVFRVSGTNLWIGYEGEEGSAVNEC